MIYLIQDNLNESIIYADTRIYDCLFYLMANVSKMDFDDGRYDLIRFNKDKHVTMNLKEQFVRNRTFTSIQKRYERKWLND